MLACDPNFSGSEFIREEASTLTACVWPEAPPSRMNSVPPVLRKLEITSNLWNGSYWPVTPIPVGANSFARGQYIHSLCMA